MPGRQAVIHAAHAVPLAAHQRARGTRQRRRRQPPSAPPGAVRPSGLRPSVLQVDHTVVVAVPPVDDAGLLGVGVDEQIEVVPDQLHLVERLVERHRRGRVGLLADHQRAFALHLERADPAWSAHRRRGRPRGHVAVAVQCTRAPGTASATSAAGSRPLPRRVVALVVLPCAAAPPACPRPGRARRTGRRPPPPPGSPGPGCGA